MRFIFCLSLLWKIFLIKIHLSLLVDQIDNHILNNIFKVMEYNKR